ncbi:hypothetical protein [Flavobacterium sp.]|jgi:hypothetical protein|uniref:hypothetical protein n=1 Tax=Flavobacterium sp. TaxID=239 RepID=UPI0037C09DA7
MKIIVSIIVLLITSSSFSQKIGERKTLTLKLMSYECVDNCYISFKDIVKGSDYDFHNIDDKINDNNIIAKIQDEYYASEQSNNFKSIGKLYTAVVEYKIVKEFEESGDGGLEYTGKKIKKWMIINLKNQINK